MTYQEVIEIISKKNKRVAAQFIVLHQLLQTLWGLHKKVGISITIGMNENIGAKENPEYSRGTRIRIPMPVSFDIILDFLHYFTSSLSNQDDPLNDPYYDNKGISKRGNSVITNRQETAEKYLTKIADRLKKDKNFRFGNTFVNYSDGVTNNNIIKSVSAFILNNYINIFYAKPIDGKENLPIYDIESILNYSQKGEIEKNLIHSEKEFLLKTALEYEGYLVPTIDMFSRFCKLVSDAGLSGEIQKYLNGNAGNENTKVEQHKSKRRGKREKSLYGFFDLHADVNEIIWSFINADVVQKKIKNSNYQVLRDLVIAYPKGILITDKHAIFLKRKQKFDWQYKKNALNYFNQLIEDILPANDCGGVYTKESIWKLFDVQIDEGNRRFKMSLLDLNSIKQKG